MSAHELRKFRPFMADADASVEAIVRAAVGALNGLEGKAAIELRVIGAEGGRLVHTARLTPAGLFLDKGVVKPTLIIIATEDALRRLADGSYAPDAATRDGKLRIQGNAGLARQILLKLSPVEKSSPLFCPDLWSDTWELTEPGIGSLTLTGVWFTPGGDVELVYDWGGGFYQQVTVANAEGSFTVTQPNIYCGNISGTNYGVAVTATDIATGVYTTKDYPTPC